MNTWFMGDMHGGHENIVKYRTQFSSCADMWELMRFTYHKKVKKRDQVFFMGDSCFSLEYLEDLKSWTAAKKILIIGNHDTDKLTMKQIVESGTYDEIYSMLKYKEFWLSHAPLHPDELRGKVNVHGHVHEWSIDDPRYFNTCPEVTDYSPVSLFEIRQEMIKRRETNPEFFQ